MYLSFSTIAEFGSEAQKERWLEPLAKGTVKLSAAIAELGMNIAVASTVSVTRDGDNWILNGERAVVPDGAVANCLLVPAVDADGNETIFLLDTALPGVSLEGVEIGLLGQRAAHLKLGDVSLDDSAVLGKPGQGAEILEWLEQRANVGHCALQVGVTAQPRMPRRPQGCLPFSLFINFLCNFVFDELLNDRSAYDRKKAIFASKEKPNERI